MSRTHLPRLAAVLAAALLAACGGGGGGGGSTGIVLRYQTTMTSAQKAAFEAARKKLEKVITGGWRSVNVSNIDCSDRTNSVTINETINGLVILVRAEDLGTSGLLAQSGPCIARQSDNLPVVAVMNINSNAAINWGDTMPAVVEHEMFHALGFGTIWPDKALINTTDHTYLGAAALAAAKSANGAPGTWTAVPAETGGGTGTMDAHWRESAFQTELMTGYITGTTQPLSLTSIKAMEDLGYTVDAGQADAFTIPFPNAAALEPGAEVGLHLGDDLIHVTPIPVAD